ncbi:hypothetical protein EDD29_1550 [Actinocorallia herbida]|uniref:Cysteine dioxygenase type I n=1 Tax=Actinocorallia herbida TaxID=58109 RepID=A0A3N1CTM4_9ACTN|nr:hypothetical protein [Actinocorallia herbida]ROO84038.1 hypothetical protein EDD29_1550 [Actinocorallia herbida]
MRYAELHRLCSAGPAPEVARWAHETLTEASAGRIEGVLHPLGFLCLPVERHSGTGVCLHLWSPELPPAPSTTSLWHCHSWELLSLLLYGGLRNTLATLADGPDLRVFRVVSAPDGDTLEATDRTVRAVPSDGGTFTRGAVYRLPAGSFHRTEVTGETATVALGADRTGAHDLTLGAPGLRSHRVRRRRGDPRQTARLARRAADLLLANGAHP